mgnify:CR=1 FL=1
MTNHNNGISHHLGQNTLSGELKTVLGVLDAFPDLAFLLSSEGEYLEIFGSSKSLLVRDAEELLGKNVQEVMPFDKAQFVLKTINQSLKEQRNISVEYELTIDKRSCLFEAGVRPFALNNVADKTVVWFARDITQQKNERERLQHLAFYDPLTKLPNRRLLEEKLAEENARCHRHQQFSAVLFIDLDRFKPVNDQHGHNIGDHVLIETARRLKQNTRQEDFVCRLAGDEFVVILSMTGCDLQQAKYNILASANHLITLLEQPFICDKIQLSLSASIGISLLPTPVGQLGGIINESDRAMYLSKQSGKGQVSFSEQLKQR